MASGIRASAFYSSKVKNVRVCFPSNAQFSDDGDSDEDSDTAEQWEGSKLITDKVIPPSFSENSSSENEFQPVKKLVKTRKKITKLVLIQDRYAPSKDQHQSARRSLFQDLTNTSNRQNIPQKDRKSLASMKRRQASHEVIGFKNKKSKCDAVKENNADAAAKTQARSLGGIEENSLQLPSGGVDESSQRCGPSPISLTGGASPTSLTVSKQTPAAIKETTKESGNRKSKCHTELILRNSNATRVCHAPNDSKTKLFDSNFSREPSNSICQDNVPHRSLIEILNEGTLSSPECSPTSSILNGSFDLFMDSDDMEDSLAVGDKQETSLVNSKEDIYVNLKCDSEKQTSIGKVQTSSKKAENAMEGDHDQYIDSSTNSNVDMLMVLDQANGQGCIAQHAGENRNRPSESMSSSIGWKSTPASVIQKDTVVQPKANSTVNLNCNNTNRTRLAVRKVQTSSKREKHAMEDDQSDNSHVEYNADKDELTDTERMKRKFSTNDECLNVHTDKQISRFHKSAPSSTGSKPTPASIKQKMAVSTKAVTNIRSSSKKAKGRTTNLQTSSMEVEHAKEDDRDQSSISRIDLDVENCDSTNAERMEQMHTNGQDCVSQHTDTRSKRPCETKPSSVDRKPTPASVIQKNTLVQPKANSTVNLNCNNTNRTRLAVRKVQTSSKREKHAMEDDQSDNSHVEYNADKDELTDKERMKRILSTIDECLNVNTDVQISCSRESAPSSTASKSTPASTKQSKKAVNIKAVKNISSSSKKAKGRTGQTSSKEAEHVKKHDCDLSSNSRIDLNVEHYDSANTERMEQIHRSGQDCFAQHADDQSQRFRENAPSPKGKKCSAASVQQKNTLVSAKADTVMKPCSNGSKERVSEIETSHKQVELAEEDKEISHSPEMNVVQNNIRKSLRKSMSHKKQYSEISEDEVDIVDDGFGDSDFEYIVPDMNENTAKSKSSAKSKSGAKSKSSAKSKSTPKVPFVQDIEWLDNDLDEQIRESVNAIDDCDSLPEPIEYFKYYFDESMLQHICNMSNLYYCVKTTKQLDLGVRELEQFIGIWIYMGLCNLPAMRDYWGVETKVYQVANTMSFNRFQKIKAALHIVDNSDLEKPRGLTDNSDIDEPGSNSEESEEVALYRKNIKDRLFKIRPLLDHMREKCKNLPQENRFSIDEVMIPYKGTFAGNLRQYLKAKPHKWGFKLFALAGVSGIIYDFIPYTGSTTFKEFHVPEDVINMGVGATAVITLCQSIKMPGDSVVHFDNWSTGIPLLTLLKEKMNLLALGTIRRDRTKKCPMTSDKALLDLGRGTSCVKVNTQGVAIVKWADNKVVCLASTVAGVNPESKVLRYDKSQKKKVDIRCPRVVELYNAHMGGVDKSDMMVALNRLPTRARRWYVPFIGYFIDLALVNSYLVYQRQAAQLGEKPEISSCKEFRQQVSKELRKTEVRQKGRPTSQSKFVKKKDLIISPRYRVADEIRYDGLGHFPSYQDKPNRCKNCKLNEVKTRVYCEKCGVNLCFVPTRNCFHQFHTRQATTPTN